MLSLGTVAGKEFITPIVKVWTANSMPWKGLGAGMEGRQKVRREAAPGRNDISTSLAPRHEKSFFTLTEYQA